MVQMIEFLSDENSWCPKEDMLENCIYARMFFENDERFLNLEIDISDWNKQDYIRQWKNAVSYSISKRCNSALFTSFSTTKKAFFCKCYILSPEEDVDIEKWEDWNFQFNKTEEEIERMEKPTEFYITGTLICLTNDVNVLTSDEIFKEISEGLDIEIPIYYIDTNRLERFYSYLPTNDAIEIQKGCWHRKVSKKYLESILRL